MTRGSLKAAAGFLGVLMAASGAMGGAVAVDDSDWTVQYLTDQSQTVVIDQVEFDQFNKPRDCRGLAVSPDLAYLYVGYNNPSNGYCVRKIDLSEPDYNNATVTQLLGYRGKAIATDGSGRVYLADESSIDIYDADLGASLGSLAQNDCEGLAFAKIGGQFYIYASERSLGTVTRYTVTENPNSTVSLAIDTTWGTDGLVTLSSNLRGLEVNEDREVWVADNDGYVHVVADDGLSFNSIAVENAFDVAFHDGVALVSRDDDLLISQIDMATLTDLDADFCAPLADLLLTDDPATGNDGTYGQIVVAGEYLYLAGEAINTANEHSTYGRNDNESGWKEGTYYTDLTHDDNDPILRAPLAPEPTTLGLLGVGALAIVFRRRRA